jgi:Protein of unknown function (DUF5818)
MKKIVLTVAGALLIFAAVPQIGTATPAQTSTQQNTPKDQTSPQKAPKEKAKVFTGTILKEGDNFVLNDSANKTTYMLDDAKKASQFEGKKVKVAGTVDLASNTIHVESIKEVA